MSCRSVCVTECPEEGKARVRVGSGETFMDISTRFCPNPSSREIMSSCTPGLLLRVLDPTEAQESLVLVSSNCRNGRYAFHLLRALRTRDECFPSAWGGNIRCRHRFLQGYSVFPADIDTLRAAVVPPFLFLRNSASFLMKTASAFADKRGRPSAPSAIRAGNTGNSYP